MPGQAEDGQWGAAPHVPAQGPARTESCHRHEHSMQHAHTVSTGTHTQSIHWCQAASTCTGALGQAQGLKMGAWTWLGAGAPMSGGICGGFTRVWLAESMVASVLSPCRGTSGMVPNFCLARSEEERRRMITGRRSSCCAKDRAGRGGSCQAALPDPSQPSPAGRHGQPAPT